VILERIYPAPLETIDLDDADSRDRLLELYRPPAKEWFRLNLIGSVTGAAIGADGTSETLSNPTDRRILGVIRELADIVVVGAESLRAESYLQPRRARLAIVTASGELTGNRLGENRAEATPPLVLCPAGAVDRVRETLQAEAEIVELDATHGRIPVAAILKALRDRGNASIVCEGGPSLAAQFVNAGVVTEFCLSTSPLVGSTAVPLLGSAPISGARATLTQLLRDDVSALYARWSLSAL
jgi:riboflavin biosynthesis pyrimidine reductase